MLDSKEELRGRILIEKIDRKSQGDVVYRASLTIYATGTVDKALLEAANNLEDIEREIVEKLKDAVLSNVKTNED